MRKKSRALSVSVAASVIVLLLSMAAGCGSSGGTSDEKNPEWATAYQAIEAAKGDPVLNGWQAQNWMIEAKSSDPDGLNAAGRSRIWEIYFFSPRPEENSVMLIIYNRGRLDWNSPTQCKGGDKGQEKYRKEKPPDFRVDSPQALSVAQRNGGGDFKSSHPEAIAEATLRCKADYDAIGEEMPAPKYKWIWTVNYREQRAGSELFQVYVDGMNGDFITKQTKTPPT